MSWLASWPGGQWQLQEAVLRTEQRSSHELGELAPLGLQGLERPQGCWAPVEWEEEEEGAVENSHWQAGSGR